MTLLEHKSAIAGQTARYFCRPGAAFMIAKMVGESVLMFVNPEWRLTEGQASPVQANIDGKVFNNNQAVEKNMVCPKVTKAIYLVDEAKFTAADE